MGAIVSADTRSGAVSNVVVVAGTGSVQSTVALAVDTSSATWLQNSDLYLAIQDRNTDGVFGFYYDTGSSYTSAGTTYLSLSGYGSLTSASSETVRIESLRHLELTTDLVIGSDSVGVLFDNVWIDGGSMTGSTQISAIDIAGEASFGTVYLDYYAVTVDGTLTIGDSGLAMVDLYGTLTVNGELKFLGGNTLTSDTISAASLEVDLVTLYSGGSIVTQKVAGSLVSPHYTMGDATIVLDGDSGGTGSSLINVGNDTSLTFGYLNADGTTRPLNLDITIGDNAELSLTKMSLAGDVTVDIDIASTGALSFRGFSADDTTVGMVTFSGEGTLVWGDDDGTAEDLTLGNVISFDGDGDGLYLTLMHQGGTIESGAGKDFEVAADYVAATGDADLSFGCATVNGTAEIGYLHILGSADFAGSLTFSHGVSTPPTGTLEFLRVDGAVTGGWSDIEGLDWSSAGYLWDLTKTTNTDSSVSYKVTAVALTEAQTSGADSWTGTSAVNIIAGLAGNDVLNGNGGRDLIYGGDGDDTITFYADAGRLDGGTGGTDTLKILNSSVDFTSLSAELLQGFEKIDLTTTASAITLSATHLGNSLTASGSNLTVDGDGADTVNLSDSGWTTSGTTSGSYTIYEHDATDQTLYVTTGVTVNGATVV